MPELKSAADGWRLPAAQVEALIRAYTSPPRAYHNFEHVLAVLRHYHDIAACLGWRQPREVYVAVCYHDAVYVPGGSDNEARSVELARSEVARFGLQAQVDIERVAELILMTARHGKLERPAVDAEAALFLDADMAIVGSDGADFDRYDAAVADEYKSVVPGFVYRFKRKHFLRELLASPRIFLSDYGHQRWDARARENLRRALTG